MAFCGPRFLKPLFFVARNSFFFAVSGNRASSAVFGFFLCFFLLFLCFFFKCHFGGHFLRFLRLGKNFRSFLVFGVSGLDGALQEVEGRKTLQNKGFWSNFAFWDLVHLRWTRCVASMLRKFFENNFLGSHNFFLFSEFGISNFWPNWVW